MTTTRNRIVIGVSAVVVAASTLAGCSASPDPDGTVTITVGNKPTSDAAQADQLKRFEEQLAAFEKANPNITVKATETAYDPKTFQTMLAGGTLPDVLSISATESATIGGTGQVADLTELLSSTGIGDDLNPTLLASTTDAQGRIYAIPTEGFAMGLVYNRAIFTQAGLDPDNPPTTWDEVRDDAKVIKDATGIDGFVHYGANNQGGWQLTTEIYSFGGRVTNDEGTASTLLDSDAAADVLQLMSDMRFDDGSIGSNTVYSYDTAAVDFAAGKFGMMVIFPQAAWATGKVNGLPAEDLGIGALPQDGGDDNGTLSGGLVTVVNAKASKAEQEAALKWIDFTLLQKYTNEDTAVKDAEAAAGSELPVGLPLLPLLDKDAQNRYDGWIEPYVNVPTENFTGFAEASERLPVIPEPVKNGQAIYARLDTVVQAVLGDPNADIDALLDDADADIDQLLTR